MATESNVAALENPALSGPPPPQAAKPLLSSIDTLTRFTASALLAVYGIGFIILGFHDARYGVVQFSPFRARILLVGLVFTTLVGVAAWAQHAQVLYWDTLKIVRADREPGRRASRDTIVTFVFIFSATVMGQVLGAFMFASVRSARPVIWRWIAWLAFWVLLTQVYSYVDRIFISKPRGAAILAVVTYVVYATILVALFPSAPWAMLAWFFALVGVEAGGVMRMGGLRKQLLYSIPLWLIIVWVYMVNIFAVLPPRWGGGQPTPVQIFQSSPAPWMSSNPIDALLLDETDQGLYVLLSPNGKAFFIPRSNVASVFFG